MINLIIVLMILISALIVGSFFIKHDGVKEENFIMGILIAPFSAVIFINLGTFTIMPLNILLGNFICTLLAYAGMKPLLRTLKTANNPLYTITATRSSRILQVGTFFILLSYIVSVKTELLAIAYFQNFATLIMDIFLLTLLIKILNKVNFFIRDDNQSIIQKIKHRFKMIFTNSIISSLVITISNAIHSFYFIATETSTKIGTKVKYPIFLSILDGMAILIGVVLVIVLPRLLASLKKEK